MDFVIEWPWYLLAFAVGAVLAWLVVGSFIKPRSADEAFEDLPGSREIGDRS